MGRYKESAAEPCPTPADDRGELMDEQQPDKPPLATPLVLDYAGLRPRAAEDARRRRVDPVYVILGAGAAMFLSCVAAICLGADSFDGRWVAVFALSAGAFMIGGVVFAGSIVWWLVAGIVTHRYYRRMGLWFPSAGGKGQDDV